MNLPDQKVLEDARWQQEYAGGKVAEFVTTLRTALQTPPADNEQARARHENRAAFVRALEYFFEANANLLNLLDEREEEMRASMSEAQFKYRQMALDRNFYQHEAQHANKRYYQENDLATLIATRVAALAPVHE